MHLFKQCVLMVVLGSPLMAENFIPQEFEQGEVIERLILISDVDGVIREGIEAVADPRIIEAIQALLENNNVDVTFISGTPVENDRSLEAWRQGNIALNKVFGSSFERELLDGRVTIFGLLGGHRMKRDGTLEVVDEYSPEISCEIGRLLLHAFFKEVLAFGSAEQKNLANELQVELDSLELDSSDYLSGKTHQGFRSIILAIREHLDPHFRLISNSVLIETHTSNPPWNTSLSSKWLQEEMSKPQYAISQLEPWQRQIAYGLCQRGELGFNFHLVGKINKGITTQKHIAEKMKRFPRALVVTLGDSQVDFPMHQNAHLAFHVGLERVWRDYSFPNCVMVRGYRGEDSQHLEGTLKVLELLKEGMGKSFYDLKYIPKKDASGNWTYYSIRELQ